VYNCFYTWPVYKATIFGSKLKLFFKQFDMPFPEFKKFIGSRLKFTLFLFLKLPAAWVCGVRLLETDGTHAVVTVPYKWLSQNPFSSIYFACQAMAAEMSTGILAMGHSFQLTPKVSMLVTNVNGQFLKKANSKVFFTCKDGKEILQTIQEAVATGEAKTFVAKSSGVNQLGEIISEFEIEWSFKVKG